MEKLTTIALVTNIPTPYRVPLFRELDEMLRIRGYRLVVIFGGHGYSRRLFAIDPAELTFEHCFLDGSRLERQDKERTSFLFRGLGRELKRLDPALVIVSGFSFATLKVFLRRLPYVVWNGSVDSVARREGLFKRMLRRLLAARASAFVAYGSAAKRYLLGLGVPELKVFIGLNTVDTSFFCRETEKSRRDSHSDDQLRLLTISYLTPRKQLIRLVETAQALSALRNDFILEVVGEGSERALLEQYVRDQGLKDRVIFTGHLQRSELPARMAASVLFLFQTGFDIWGLTVNEAMAAGLPVCCSPNAGSAPDLIFEGETGFMIDYSDPSAAARKIDSLLDRPELLQRVGATASSFISRRATLETSAQGFVQAVLYASGDTRFTRAAATAG